MLKLRKFLEQANGNGLVVTNWEKLDKALRETCAFLDDSIVCNEGEMSSRPTPRAADGACQHPNRVHGNQNDYCADCGYFPLPHRR